MPQINGQDVRTVLLEVIRDNNPGNTHQSLQSGTILQRAAERLGIAHNIGQERILLTEWHELFRTGYMAWGHNFANANPPFCHVTNRGEQALENVNRDPSNPHNYLQHLQNNAEVNEISLSYLKEALDCYVGGSFKASAVMIGGAAESIILELRDATLEAIRAHGEDIPRGLEDWKIRTITNALSTFYDSKKRYFNRVLREEYEAYWAAFTQQIRSVRNDVGHPSSIDPITPDTVHASFLIFPELASLAGNITNWVENEYQ